MAPRLVECIPNISNGRDPEVVDKVEGAITSVSGTVLLHRTSDWDHNRSVLTFAGPPPAIEEAALRAVEAAAQSIDLRHHTGVHPRLGALDVLPFVPLKGLALEDCVALAHNVGRRIANELGIPVYFYGAAALRPDRVKLEDVRRGQFEGLSEAVATDERKAPDLGGPHLHPTAGAVVVGARKILIAFNVNLESESLPLAKSIAKRIRERDGGFPGVKALGLSLPTRGLVQVSMNITDFEAAPLHVVYAEIVRLAAEAGVPVFESELIGLMPRQALEMAAAGFLQMSNFQTTSVIENQLEAKLREP